MPDDVNCPSCNKLYAGHDQRSPVDLGHDALAHRIYRILLRERITTRDDLLARADEGLDKLRNVGTMIAGYIRDVLAQQDGCIDGYADHDWDRPAGLPPTLCIRCDKLKPSEETE